jgi:hypothetical protein
MKNQLSTLLLLIVTTFCSLNTTAQKISLLGKKIKAKDICGDCAPGNHGLYMVMKKKTFEPQIEDNSTAKTIAHQILGHVFPENNKTGRVKIPCSTNSATTPFPIILVKPLSAANGTLIDYKEKELLNINVSLTVDSDLQNIKAAQPSIELAKLDEFKAKLTAAYSKFANKELSIQGRYYSYGLDDNAVIELAKNIKYSDCRNYIYKKDFQKRIITAIGLVFFDIESSENTVDDISTKLQADAMMYGITFNVSAEFKRNISKNLKKTTNDYYQIVVWRTMGVDQLETLAN